MMSSTFFRSRINTGRAMRHLVALFTFGLLVAAGVMATSSTTADSFPQDQVSEPAVASLEKDHYLYTAFYSTRDGQKSTLALNNAFIRTLNARVTLYNKRGRALVVSNIDLAPASSGYFNVADWLSGPDAEVFSEGSLEVFFHGPNMGLGGQLVISDERRGISFDVPFTEDGDFGSSRLDSLWLALDDRTSAEVFLANTKADRLIVTPTFYVGGESVESEPVVLGAHESTSLNIRQTLQELRVRSSMAVGGISLRHTGPNGSLAVAGAIINRQTGFSSSLRFIDSSMQKSSTLHGAHLLVGRPSSRSGLPIKSRFAARAAVRNTTDLPVEVRTTFRYRTDGSADRADDTAGSVELAPLILVANEVREIDLREVTTSMGSRVLADAGLEIVHSGQPGSVVAAAVSFDQSGGQVFDVPIKDPMAKKMAGGSHPWRIGGDERAVLHLKNIDSPSETSMRQAFVVLYYEGGSYSLPVQQVETGQTFEVDIKKLRDEQIPDGFGNIIPAGVIRGQVRWFGRGELGQFIGRLVQYNPVTATSSSFSCPIPCPCEPSFERGEIEGGPIQGSPGDRFFVNLVDVIKDCNGHIDRYPVQDPGATVSSDSPLTASVSGPVTDPYGGLAWQVTLGNQAGMATIRGSWRAVKWRSTCLGFSFGSNCSEFRCNFSYAVGSASTTASLVPPQITSISPPRGLIGITVDVNIVGRGFGSNPTVQVAGTGISVAYDFRGDTEILARFAIAANAQPGNHAVTVRVGTQISNSVNFFVYVPTRLVRNSLSDVIRIDPGPGNVVDSFGQIVATNRCGAYRRLTYTLVDQSGQTITDEASITESFSNYQGPPDSAPESRTVMTTQGQIGDVVGMTKTYPNCPSNGEGASFNQSFTATIFGMTFNLTTANSIQMQKSSGNYTITITMTNQ